MGAPQNILIVEDERIVARDLQRTLRMVSRALQGMTPTFRVSKLTR